MNSINPAKSQVSCPNPTSFTISNDLAVKNKLSKKNKENSNQVNPILSNLNISPEGQEIALLMISLQFKKISNILRLTLTLMKSILIYLIFPVR